jgi:hypothetical protein
VVRTLYAVTAFAMWLRLLYFFRIFENTNFYIKMLISVVADMGQFMFIFVFTLLAFAHTFYLFFMNHNGIVLEDGTVMSSEFNSFSDAFIFSYNTVFGEYSLGNFPLYIPWVAWVFFILETMWVVVILLNLLISIVGGTYGKVNDNKSSIMFQDMVEMIVENDFLLKFPQFSWMQKDGVRGKYLILVTPEDGEVE